MDKIKDHITCNFHAMYPYLIYIIDYIDICDHCGSSYDKCGEDRFHPMLT